MVEGGEDGANGGEEGGDDVGHFFFLFFSGGVGVEVEVIACGVGERGLRDMGDVVVWVDVLLSSLSKLSVVLKAIRS